MSTLFDNLVSGGGGTYFDDLNAAPSGGSSPAVVSIGTLRYLGSATITGSNFGASQGAGGVTIGGVSQPVTAWSATSITIGPIARGTLRYGTQNVVVTHATAGSSTPSAQSFLPQAGWSFVDLTNPLATSGQRITSTPDLVAGDQLAYGDVSPSGNVTVAADGSFTTTGAVGSFSVEANDGTGWGGFGVQFVANVEAFSGTIFAAPATVQGSFAVQVPSTARTFSGSIHPAAATMAGTFIVFTGKQFSGQIVVGSASTQGAFAVIGAVVTPPAPSTPAPGTGTPESKIAIVNVGLVTLGVPTIRAFNEDSKAARIASQIYDHVRDRELAKHIWKFALARKNMPEFVSDEPRGSYRYTYTKPVDWLHTVWLGTLKLGTPEASHDVEDADWSHEGEYILCNIAPPLPLQYIRRLTDPTKYDVLFNAALGKALAMEMADALTDSTTKWDKARAEYKDAIAEARRKNAILDPPRSQSADSWLDARL